MNRHDLRLGLTVLRPSRLRRVRLTSGFVLFLYVTLHLLNHALGNISVDAMSAGLSLAKRLWQSPPGSLALYGAATIHMGLGLWALYERRHFQWTAGEALQLASGLLIPVLLANHVAGTRGALALYGVDKGYPQELYALTIDAMGPGLIQVLVLCLAWTHGCLGLHFWLRLRPSYGALAPVLLALAVLVPVLALLGFAQGGRAIAVLIQDPAWRAKILAPALFGTPQQGARLAQLRWLFVAAFATAVMLTMAMRGVRVLRERWAGRLRVSYVDGPVVTIAPGLSVLDASRLHRIPHASVCGGRGRCSTCRVRVLGDPAALPAPSAAEAAVLNRIKADPHVRLACQLKPQADIALLRLLPPQATATDGRRAPMLAGEERHVVVMFVDMRDSTRLAEHRLPFDTFFILNRFHAAVGRAVTEAGGRPNQILGDGLLAIFGLEDSLEAACRQALTAAVLIGRNIDHLNAAMRHELHEPIRFGIGIDAGPVILGELGFDQHNVLTVMGDTVNRAARFEELSKDLARQVVFAEGVAFAAGLWLEDLSRKTVVVPGRIGSMVVYFVDADAIASRLNVSTRRATSSVP